MHPHYELSVRHRVPRALPPLKSLILAGINEFLEESHGITLPRVTPVRDAIAVVVVDAGGYMQFCKLELNLPRREREQIRSSRGKCLAMALGKWGS